MPDAIPDELVRASHAEWTPDGLLRHNVYMGQRQDKPAIDVRRDPPHTRLRSARSSGTRGWSRVDKARSRQVTIAIADLRPAFGAHAPDALGDVGASQAQRIGEEDRGARLLDGRTRQPSRRTAAGRFTKQKI